MEALIKYQQNKSTAYSCLLSRVFRSPLFTPPPPTFFDTEAILRGRVERRAAEAAKKEEEARPPAFEVEAAEAAKKKRAARVAARRVFRTSVLKVVEWEPAPVQLLAFRLPERRCVDEVDARREHAEKYYRVQRAEQLGLPVLRLGGVVVPAINGWFYPYLPKRGEARNQWRARLFRLRSVVRQTQRFAKDQERLDLPLYEQISRSAQTLGTLKNPFSPLKRDVFLDGFVRDPINKGASEESYDPLWKRTWPRRSKQSVAGCKTNFGWSYIQSRLALKAKRAALHDEWREARSLRREKMARALVQLGDHQFVSLKSALTKLILNNYKNTTEFPSFEQECDEYYSRDEWHPVFKNELVAQMEVEGSDAQGKAGAATTKKSNVVVQQQVGKSVGDSLPGGSKDSSYSKLSAVESVVSSDTFHCRDFTILSTTWQASQEEGAELFNVNFPKAVFTDSSFKDSPGWAAFARHAYAEFEAVFTVHGDFNVRQFGQAIVSFYYSSIQDSKFASLRQNIYVASQRLHALVTANFSNEAEIRVPFEYVFPVLAINRVPLSKSDSLHLGTLLCNVVVPLTAPATCPNYANVKLRVRFERVKVSGMIGISIAQAQMMPALATIVAVKSLLDRNRDNPTVITPGTPVIPVNSSSWCYGNGQATFNNVLRLNPNSVLPYGDGRIPPIDEMKIDYVKKIKGMVKIVEWNKSHEEGSLLFSWDAAPLVDFSEYPSMIVDKKSCSIIPPYGILSSLFAYWRGGQILSADIVAATEISGSLLFCYVPRVTKDFPMSMKQAYSCSHAIFKIAENRQINFKIPYVANHMFWPRQSTLSTDYPKFGPPGAIFVFVYNRLIVNCSIPDRAKLVFYLSADDDFEYAVPACPSIGLSFNPSVVVAGTTDRRFVFNEGYFPFYFGSWHSAYMHIYSQKDIGQWSFMQGNGPITDWSKEGTPSVGDTLYFPVLRYGPVSDHVSQVHPINFDFPKTYWKNFSTGCYCQFVGLTESKSVITLKTKNVGNRNFKLDCSYGWVWNQDGYNYVIPVPTQVHAASTGFLDRLNIMMWADGDCHPGAGWYMQMLYYFRNIKQDFNFQDCYFDIESSDYWVPASSYLNVLYPSVANAEADEKTDLTAPIAEPQVSAPSSASSLVFGENFSDLKDFCRRYQLYASDSLVLDKLLDTQRWRSISIRFPVMPQGLDLDIGEDTTPNEYWNRTREGPIPLIASGYRFFSGGIRFRICLNVTQIKSQATAAKDVKEIKCKVFVQHRPNIASKFRKVLVQSGATLGSDDLELPGYAAYHQVDETNMVISVEVPYYQPTIRTYLQEPTLVNQSLLYTGLGELAIGLTVYNYEKIKLDYDIYYALADDARFSVFVGFPPVFDITRIPNTVPPASAAAITAKQLDEAIKSIEEPTAVTVVETEVEEADRIYNMLVLLKDKDPDLKANWDKVLNLRIESQVTQDYSFFISESKRFLESIKNTHSILEAQMGLLDGTFKNTKATISKVEDSIDNINTIVNEIDVETVGKFKKIVNNISDFTDKLKDVSPLEKVKEFFNVDEGSSFLGRMTEKCSAYIDVVIAAITNLVHCIINFNPKTIAWSLFSFLVQCKIISIKSYEGMRKGIYQILQYMGFMKNELDNASAEQPNLAEMPFAQMADMSEDDSVTCGYVSSLIAGVAALFSFVPKFCSARKSELGSLLLQGLTKGSQCANNIFTFLRNNLLCIKRIMNWIYNDHPSIKKLGPIANKDNSLYEWAKEVLLITDPRKENQVFIDPKLASTAYELAAQANILKLSLLTFKFDHQEVKLLEHLCKKIDDLVQRLSKTHLAPPVRFEPFVFELTGGTGIGKSYLLSEIPYKLFRHCNMTHSGELIYHRALGNAYWNNLRNQPVCIIDEKFPVKGPGFLDVQLAELFQLKSKCIFNPPMADIPDKNIRYNPLIVGYASNAPFPQIDDVLDVDAVYRRRDTLVRVRMNAAMRAIHGEKCKYSMLSNREKKFGGGDREKPYAYLEFQFCNNVCANKDDTGVWDPPCDYTVFINKICQQFQNFYIQEETKYRQALRLMSSVLPDSDTVSSVDQLLKYDWLDKVNATVEPSDDKNYDYTKQISKLYKSSFDKDVKIWQTKFRIAYLEKFCPSEELEIVELAKLLKDLTMDPANVQLVANMNVSDKEANLNTLITKVQTFPFSLNIGQFQGQDKCIHFIVKDFMGNNCIYDPSTDEFKIDLTTNLLDNIATKMFNCVDDSPYDLTRSTPWEDLVHCFEKENIMLKELAKDKANLIKYSLDENKFVISGKPCGRVDCCLKDTSTYKSWLINGYIHSNYIARIAFSKAEITPDIFPTRFINALSSKFEGVIINEIKIHDTLRERISNKFYDFTAYVKTKVSGIDWKKWFKRIAIVLGIVAFVGSIFGVVKFSRAGNSEKAASCAVTGIGAAVKVATMDNPIVSLAEGHVSGDYKTSRGNSKSTQPASKIILETVRAQAQGGYGIRNESVILRTFTRNSFFLALHNGKAVNNGRCLGICGNYALITEHYYEAWQNESQRLETDDMLFISMRDKHISSIKLKFSELKHIPITNSGLSIIKLPARFPFFKDIRNYIAPRNLHSKLNLRGSILELVLHDQNTVITKMHTMDFKPFHNLKVAAGKLWKDFEVHDGYEYEGFSGPGLCGSLLLGNGIESPIIGMHIAGYTNQPGGVSEAVYREMFDNLGMQPNPHMLAAEGGDSRWYVDSQVIGVGKVPTSMAHQERGKSRIIPSLLRLRDVKKEFEVFTAPAVLDRKDPRISEHHFSPMLEGCKHHGNPLIPFNKDDLKLAIDDLNMLILANCKPCRNPGLLTVDEAVGGFEGLAGYEHLEFKTSEGFPFSSFRPKGCSNKRWLFNFDQDNKYISTKDELSTVLKYKWNQRLNNEIPATVFIDCLKDCTIEHEKVLVPGKTRIFSMSPVDFTIHQRQCTLDFVVAYMANRRNLEHMIGCNVNSVEWSLLAHDLLKKGDSILTGDYSKYGDSLPFEFIQAAFQIISNWYKFNGVEDEQLHAQLKIFPYEIGHAYHLMFDHLYQTVCGQPSGNSLTVVINSIANSLYIRCAWLQIMKNSAFNSLKDLHDNIQIFSYGDDLIISLSDKVKDIFNAESLHHFFAAHNLKFTNANKSNEIVKYDSLINSEFLKCKFLEHPTRRLPQMLLAPLRESSIEDTVNWVWSESFDRDDPLSLTFQEMSIQVCEDSVRNAFGRGPEYYERWSTKVKNFWLSQGIHFKILTWEQMDYKIFDLKMDLSPYHKWVGIFPNQVEKKP